MIYPFEGVLAQRSQPDALRLAMAVCFTCFFCFSSLTGQARAADVLDDPTWSRYAKRQQAFDDCVRYSPLPVEPQPSYSPPKKAAPKKRRTTSAKAQPKPSTQAPAPKTQDCTPVLVPVMVNPICPDSPAKNSGKGTSQSSPGSASRSAQGTGTAAGAQPGSGILPGIPAPYPGQ